MTMTLVRTATVGAGGAASIDFTSIPQTGTDLVIILAGRQAAASFLLTYLTLNGSGSTYILRSLYGWAGTAATTAVASNGIDYTQAYGTATANTFSNTTFYISNYRSSTTKSISIDSSSENDSSQAPVLTGALTWATNDPITSISLSLQSTTYVQNSSASLYLVTKGSGGATVT